MEAYLARAQAQSQRAGRAAHDACMQITFKLYASLTDYLPAEARIGNRDAAGAARGHHHRRRSIEPFGLPPKLVHLVLVNGVYVAARASALTRVLQDGDVLAIWPPVAGG